MFAAPDHQKYRDFATISKCPPPGNLMICTELTKTKKYGGYETSIGVKDKCKKMDDLSEESQKEIKNNFKAHQATMTGITLKEFPDINEFYLCYNDYSHPDRYHYYDHEQPLFYLDDDMMQVYNTAVMTFNLVKENTPNDKIIELHIGNWGSGIFKGNKLFAAVAQIIAAQTNGITNIIYHDVDKNGVILNEEILAKAVEDFNEFVFDGDEQIDYQQLQQGFKKLAEKKRYAFGQAISTIMDD